MVVCHVGSEQKQNANSPFFNKYMPGYKLTICYISIYIYRYHIVLRNLRKYTPNRWLVMVSIHSLLCLDHPGTPYKEFINSFLAITRSSLNPCQFSDYIVMNVDVYANASVPYFIKRGTFLPNKTSDIWIS